MVSDHDRSSTMIFVPNCELGDDKSDGEWRHGTEVDEWTQIERPGFRRQYCSIGEFLERHGSFRTQNTGRGSKDSPIFTASSCVLLTNY